MTRDQDFTNWDKKEFEMLEEEIQTLLQTPIPIDPSFKKDLRAELLREHKRLYGKANTFKWRLPLGIVSGTAAALLLLSITTYFSQGDPPLNQAGLNGPANDLAWEEPAKQPGAGKENPNSTPPSTLSETEELSPQNERQPSNERQLAMEEDSDKQLETEVEEGAEGSSRPDSDGHGIAMTPSQADESPASGGKEHPQESGNDPETQPWQEDVPADREFVFSSSSITMSKVVPFQAEGALPSNIELKVSGEALPAEKQVFTFAQQLPYDLQQRQAMAQTLGLGDNEEATTRGFRYRGVDGSTLLFRTDGIPQMEYAYRGTLADQAASLDGEQLVKRAADFLRQLQVDVSDMSIKVHFSSDSDKWTVAFVPELAGAPNLAGMMTVTLKQGQVVEASIPLLKNVQAKPASFPLVSLTEVLQRVVLSEEYLIRPDEKVVITEAELVYYPFGKGILAPAYQLRGTEEKSGKLVQLIVSAVQE